MTGVEEKSDADRVSQNKIRMNDQQKTDWHWHAANRYAALAEDEEHEQEDVLPSTPTPNRSKRKTNKILTEIEDEASVGTTHSTETIKRNNTMPSRARTRGEAWKIIKQQNWVQQTIADRDKRWCPTCMDKHMSPAERVGAKEYKAKLMDNKNELTWACADSGCTANI